MEDARTAKRLRRTPQLVQHLVRRDAPIGIERTATDVDELQHDGCWMPRRAG
jgi:hypothetical protein